MCRLSRRGKKREREGQDLWWIYLSLFRAPVHSRAGHAAGAKCFDSMDISKKLGLSIDTNMIKTPTWLHSMVVLKNQFRIYECDVLVDRDIRSWH